MNRAAAISIAFLKEDQKRSSHLKECFVNKTSVLGVIDTDLDHATLASPTQRPVVNEYTELKRLIKQRRLLKKQPVYYTSNILYTLILLAPRIAPLFFITNFS